MATEFDDVMTRFASKLDSNPALLRKAVLAMSSFVYAAAMPSDDQDALQRARHRFINSNENLMASTISLNPKQFSKLHWKSLKTVLRLLSLSPYGSLLFATPPEVGSPAFLIRKTICSWLSLLDAAISETSKMGDTKSITVSDVNLALQALDAGEQHPFFTAAKGTRGSARRRLSVAIEQYKAVYAKRQLAKASSPNKYEINQFIAMQCGGCYSPDRIRKWEKTFDKKLSKKQKRLCKKHIDKRVLGSNDKTTVLLDELGGALNRLYKASYKSVLEA